MEKWSWMWLRPTRGCNLLKVRIYGFFPFLKLGKQNANEQPLGSYKTYP